MSKKPRHSENPYLARRRKARRVESVPSLKRRRVGISLRDARRLAAKGIRIRLVGTDRAEYDPRSYLDRYGVCQPAVEIPLCYFAGNRTNILRACGKPDRVVAHPYT